MTTRLALLSVLPTADRWVTLTKLEYRDGYGQKRLWEMAERTTRRGAIDAVAVFALLKAEGLPTKTVLVTQFRPPANKTVRARALLQFCSVMCYAAV